MITKADNKNILLQQIFADGDRKSVKEIKPFFSKSKNSIYGLSYGRGGDIMWYPFVDGAFNTDDNGFNVFDSVEGNKIKARSLEAGDNVELTYTKSNKIKISVKSPQADPNFNYDNIINLFEEGENIQLKKTQDGKLRIDVDYKFIDKQGKIKDTELYYNYKRLGVGRKPLYNYILDIGVEENSVQTGVHIGDGTYGFSLGNGAEKGFVPQVLGMGAHSNDAGLYLIGRASKNNKSSTPLVIIDGRNRNDENITNRPIFGITSADYNNYKFLINQFGNVGIGKEPNTYKVEAEGKIKAKDFILDNNLSLEDLFSIVKDQNEKIKKLKELCECLIKKL